MVHGVETAAGLDDSDDAKKTALMPEN